MRLVAALLFLVLAATPAAAQVFVTVAFHDVVDDGQKLGADDITTGQLVAFFDWLAGNGWSCLSLDDVEAARTGQQALPPKSILLTFDDGYASTYSRVYPLLQAYRFHAVFFLVGAWMEEGATVRYGEEDVPRSRFLSWDQAREMSASGLAEFGSHGYALHRGIEANPQGSMIPAAAAWAYDAATHRYEKDGEMKARVLADFRRARDQLRAQLDRAPRALAWPFGRYAGPALAAARDAGFSYAMNLTPEPSDASNPFAIARFYPAQTPALKTIVPALGFDDPDPKQTRLVCLNLGDIAAGDAAQNDAALGRTIENLRRMGATTVVLDPAATGMPGQSIASVWQDSALLPVKTDFLGFAAWQIHSRAGVEVFLRLDLKAAASSVGPERIGEFVREMLRSAPVDGIVLDPPGTLLHAGAAPAGARAWNLRAEREKLLAASAGQDDDLALLAWRVAEETRPGLKLAIPAPAVLDGWPAADLILLSPGAGGPVAMARDLAQRGWLSGGGARLVLPLAPQTSAEEMRVAQALGASAFSLCPARAPPRANPAFSAARFPRLP